MKNTKHMRDLLVALFLLLPTMLVAAPVSLQKAQAIAVQFMQQRGMATAPQLTYRLPQKAASANSYYYVFNSPNGKGFVIVSGDDRTPQVLGYSDKGSLDMDALPTNIRAFLQTYADEIKHLDATDATKVEPKMVLKAEKAKYAVSPLLRTQWNQDTPYNNNCPVINGNQTVTGCVATATAQAMAYFRWPAKTSNAIPSYTSTSKSGSQSMSRVSAGTTIDWANILDDYTGTTTTEQQNAVANLMLYVGKSVQMSYDIATNGGSGAQQSAIAPALTTYFDYSAHNLDRSDYTLAQFEDSIFEEVANNRPVIFCGSSSGGGHCFIIDGYDGDGLFHVNWGWGGMADGYFLMSVMNPNNNSGIGASTTSDGYTMYQSAVIGLAKGNKATASEEAMMTVYDQTIRNDSLVFSIYNMTSGTHKFDISITLIGEDGTATPITTLINGSELKSYYGFSNISIALKDLGLRAGTYYIAVASKESSSSKWLYKEKDIVELVIDSNGNIVTAKQASSIINLSVSKWEPVGTLTAGSAQTMNITIANSGSEYYGNVYLFASTSNSKGDVQSQTGLTAKGNGETTIQMSFTPSYSGTYTLWLCSDGDGKNVIGSTTVTVGASTSSTVNLSSSFTPSNGSTIYGKVVEGTCRITNNGSSAYNGSIATAVFDANDDYANVGQSTQDVSIPAGGSVDIPFSYKEPAGQYFMAAFYLTSSSYKQIGAGSALTLADGIITYKADGTKTGQTARSSLTVGADAVAIDLTGVENTVTRVNTTNANPNTLYYFSSASAPAVASLQAAGRNVVIGSTADNLTITDGYDFYCPAAFTATNATYKRTATIGTEGNGGWETICLPFEASTVTANGLTRHWFTSTEDTGRDFWLMEFSELDGSTVVFDFNRGSSLKANMPYIIAVPNAHWGEQYNLVNKEMTFSGTNVKVKPTSDAKILISTSAYNFIGSTVNTTTANDFLMNNGGTAFARTASATSAPFRAFFRQKTVNDSQTQMLDIRTPGGSTTGITNVNANADSDTDAPAYNLAGQRVGKTYKGIVVRNGKKSIVK